MPKRRAPQPLAVCPDTYLDAFEQAFDEAADAALDKTRIPSSALEDTRMRLLEMKTSVLEAIRERVELADDPAADAVPRPLDRRLVTEIAKLEKRADELAASVKRLRQQVPTEVEQATDGLNAAVEAALTAPVDSDDDDEEDGDVAGAAASRAQDLSAACLDASSSLKAARAALVEQQAAVLSTSKAVEMAAGIGTTAADRAAAGKGAPR